MRKNYKLLLIMFISCFGANLQSYTDLIIDGTKVLVEGTLNLAEVFKSMANTDPEFADAVLDPMLKLQLVDGTKVLTDADCESLPNGAQLTLVSQTTYFVQSEAISNRQYFWSEALEKGMMNNEERFVLPVRDGLHMVFYGTNYETHRWWWNPEPGVASRTCALSKWFFSDLQTIKNMSVADKHALLTELAYRSLHRIELIQRSGPTLKNYVLRIEEINPDSIIELFTKLLELKNTDEIITEDKLPQPQWDGHKWITSHQDFTSTYQLFKKLANF